MTIKEFQDLQNNILENDYHFTQEDLDAMDELILEDSTKMIRYLEEQKEAQSKYNRKMLALAVLTLIFSAVAAVGTIIGILL